MLSRVTAACPRGRSAMLFAVLMAVFQCVLITVIAAHQGSPAAEWPLGYLLLAGSSLALAWRHRHPLGVLLTTTALCYAYYGASTYWLHYPVGPALLVPAVAMFGVGARTSLRTTVISGGVLALLVPVLAVAGAWLTGGPLVVPPWWLAVLGVFTATGAAGVAARNRRMAAAAARERRAEAERRRAEERRLAIAREVHDVVAHSLATINVQAGVAAHVADRRPEQAKAALLAIKEASHTALEDLRATLAVLRTGDADTAPAPSLTRLDELTARATDLGLRVTVDGDPAGLPAPVDAAAYRIVQEAITNTVRHAAGATAITVHIGRSAERLGLTVSDDGRPQPESLPGNGLRGMRERVDTLHGVVRAGFTPDGFTVRADIPLATDGSPGSDEPLTTGESPSADPGDDLAEATGRRPTSGSATPADSVPQPTGATDRAATLGAAPSESRPTAADAGFESPGAPAEPRTAETEGS